MATVTWLREAKLLGATDPESYQKELLAILANLGTLSGQAETEAIRILSRARGEVIDRLAQLGLESPSRAMYQRALAGVDQATANMAADLGKSLEALQTQAIGAGFDLAVKPIAGERGLEILASAITQDQLRILSQYSADLIQGLQADIRSKVNAELASVVIGAKSPQSAAVAIGKNLTDKNHFSTIAHRARAIVVTEVGRAQALGTQAGMNTLAATLKAAGDSSVVRKRWLNGHLPGARQTHLEAEARYAPDGSIGPIPVDQLFEIGGFKALYPRDPSLPASESVHCHCVTVTVIDEGSFAAVAQGPPAQAAQAAYTAAKVKAAAPADVATTKGLLGQKAAAFAADPWTAAGLKADKVLKNGQTGYGGTFLAKALGYTDPKKSGFVYDPALGAFKHKLAPDGHQIPKLHHLPDAELKALMAAADLDPGEQGQILTQVAKAKKASPPPAPYAVKKPDVPPPAAPPPAAFIPEPPKPKPIPPPAPVAAPAAAAIPTKTYTAALGELKTRGLVTHPGGHMMRLAPDGNTVQVFTPATGKWVKYNPATDVWHPELGSSGIWVRTAKPRTPKVLPSGEPSPLGVLRPAWDPNVTSPAQGRRLVSGSNTPGAPTATAVFQNRAIDITGTSSLYDATTKLKQHIMTTLARSLDEFDRANPGAVASAFNTYPKKYGRSSFGNTPAEQLADTMINSWAATSGDTHPGSLALQRAAAEVFDLTWPPVGYKGQKGVADAIAAANVYYEANAGLLQTFIRAMHTETQKELARLYPGQNSVRLARGIKRQVATATTSGGTADVMMNPMSSFSVNTQTAIGFAGGKTTLYAEVPFERIIGTALSGFGCFGEFEMVVLGSRAAETVVAVAGRH